MISRTLSTLAIIALAACDAARPDAGEPDLAQTLAEAPPGAAPGTCWGKRVTPAVIQTVTDQVLVQPADVQPGSDAATGIYRTETHQAIVQERKLTWFETPCPADLTPDFVSSLQRALQAREFYRGAITGEMDTRTRAAIRRYQQPDGLDSGILSLTSARKLGLVAVERLDA
ncbi:peptidoglycan-binding protein [Pelagivirga sediminicola]|uniref:Peptidoglycan-binding protein n=1 Tax=Pelagivirga sediminicola TaxID=2170575 RepID=A0A2T7G6I9_9RHOB|nr:peptidoglycan-binding domain-containing protein [Pelagivirga sediminicola]PVA10041.1 peptidoglycan-binding protein [Pelagivirga sediminicola]